MQAAQVFRAGLNSLFEGEMPHRTTEPGPRSLFRAIATDVHFWIPLIVLAGGFLLLDKLR
jgi:hypothetical protein